MPRGSARRISSATRSEATSRCSSPRGDAHARWSRSRRPVAGTAAGSLPELLQRQRGLLAAAKAIAPHAAAITATPGGRRRATELIVGDPEGIPAELIAHLMLGVAACPRAADLLDRAGVIDWAIDAARIDYFY